MSKTGKIRHRITLQDKVLSADGAGGFIHTWQTVTGLWAFIRPVTSRKLLQSNKQTTRSAYEIVIRYRTDITSDMRILFGSRIFHILTTHDRDGKKQWVTCICEEEE